jgi:hypothetical protein
MSLYTLALLVARGAIDALIDMASDKATTMSTDLLRDCPLVQAQRCSGGGDCKFRTLFYRRLANRMWMVV